MEHTGKHALVTGGGSGIGRAIALALAAQGATITITGRRAEMLEEVAGLSDRIHPAVMDVTDEAAVRDGIATAADRHGPVALCIANAGIATGGPFLSESLDGWRRTMATNLDGVFLTFQAALQTLPQDAAGRYIVVSSIAGVRGLKNAIPYTVTKHGVIGLIRGLSEEFLRKRPVTFNALCPGYVDTDIVHSQLPGLMRRFDVDRAGAEAIVAKGNRHKQLLEVDETTAAALWLCSDAARSVNGQTIQIAGGQV
ncbi:NAD(P)-dependent dehydrogenase, short-chain alcohol dehydrogenase family [Loktanella fryxellensis]|uniref:NAD(P)-dependent dehydrogenase, short-chain alcohol dehydrogenase family n=1 Tax=Loktanella fryxellensis TaxID=245187 RepID=A0A1H8BNK6_9RHOB|nr:SDR family oxidoreductase [Loktanella fryxellensis]SEM84352.1 NAD(P)-dependent dehydrogenase, short-chain alcohol dehydrogenase family [Loktanella fryxellensis]